MKKALLLAAMFVFIYGSGIGQQVFYSGFETWTSTHKPTDWFGTVTNIDSLNVTQVTSGQYQGTYSVQLANTSSSHKRFTTTDVSVTAGQAYQVSFYVKGSGSIRAGLFDGGGSSAAYSYATYDSINSPSAWVKVEQQLVCDTTSATAEFMISLKNTSVANGHFMVDSFYVTTISTSNVSIHDIQYTTTDASSYLGQPVNTGGIVSAVKSGAYWIQNGTGPWSGVYVYDAANSPALGDSVTFSAVVDEYYNLTELKSVSSFVIVSSGNPVQVTPLNIPDAPVEMYEGVLANFNNVSCTAMPDTYLEWMIGDGMNTLTVGDLIYAYTPTLGTYYDVTGVMDYNFSVWKVQPRFAADVTLHNAIEENEISASVYPNPSSDYVTVTAETEGVVRISDVTGRIVYSSVFNQNVTLNVSEFEAGLYNVTITGNDGSFAISKLMVK